MKHLIKSLLIAGLFSLGVYDASALSTSLTLANGAFTNFPYLNQGGAKLTQIIVSSSTTNVVKLSFVDTATNSLTYTIPAFTNVLTYATNVSKVYTNYYNVVTTNIWTNALVDLSNYVASVTVTNNMPLNIQINTNTTSKFDAVNYYFLQGVWVTNGTGTSAAGPAIVTITYQQ
jgi:hypothetical protein